MSATNRGGERKVLDAYYTDPRVARALVATLPIRPEWTWLEPSVGAGAFVQALRERHGKRRPVIYGCDLDPRAAGLALCDGGDCGDFLALDLASAGGFDAVVGNPPFGDAEAHVRRAIAVVREGGIVAFLLRLAFLESARRFRLWSELPPEHVHVLSERPSFTGGGTDNCAYGFFRWRKGFRGEPRLSWLSWAERAGELPPWIVAPNAEGVATR